MCSKLGIGVSNVGISSLIGACPFSGWSHSVKDFFSMKFCQDYSVLLVLKKAAPITVFYNATEVGMQERGETYMNTIQEKHKKIPVPQPWGSSWQPWRARCPATWRPLWGTTCGTARCRTPPLVSLTTRSTWPEKTTCRRWRWCCFEALTPFDELKEKCRISIYYYNYRSRKY